MLTRAFPLLLSLAITIVIASSTLIPAYADSPSPREMARLGRRLERSRLVQVDTRQGTVDLHGARVDADGIAYRGIVASTLGDSLPVPGLIAWNRVGHVRVRGNYAGRGAVVGGIAVGLVVGGLAAWAFPQEAGVGAGAHALAGVYFGLIGSALGVGLGAGAGALIPAWHTIYVSDRATHPGR